VANIIILLKTIFLVLTTYGISLNYSKHLSFVLQNQSHSGSDGLHGCTVRQ